MSGLLSVCRQTSNFNPTFLFRTLLEEIKTKGLPGSVYMSTAIKAPNADQGWDEDASNAIEDEDGSGSEGPVSTAINEDVAARTAPINAHASSR